MKGRALGRLPVLLLAASIQPFPVPVLAQEGPVLTMEAALERASQHNPRYRRALKDLELSEIERVRLHRHVASRLGLPTGSAAPVPSRRRRFSWAALAPIAAVFVAFAVALPIIGTQLNRSDDLAEPVAEGTLAPSTAVTTTLGAAGEMPTAGGAEEDNRFAATEPADTKDDLQGSGGTTVQSESTDDAVTLPYFPELDDAGLIELRAIAAAGPDSTASAAPLARRTDPETLCAPVAADAAPVALLRYQAAGGDAPLDAVALLDGDGQLLILTTPACDELAIVTPDGLLTTP